MKFKSHTILTMAVSAGLLTATGSALAQSLGGAYAQGDILVGFTKGSGNDLIANLGPVGTALVNGNSWDFGNMLATNVLNGDTLDSVSWGVVGVSIGPNKVYSTSPSKPNTFASQSGFNTINTAMNGFGAVLNGTTGFGTPSSSAAGDGSWFIGTIAGGSGTFNKAYGNPNVSASSTSTSTASFFTTTEGLSTTNVVQTGVFKLSPTGVLSFSTSIITTPPPPQIVSITRSGNTSTVIFTTTNGSFTYSLLYTNTAGLSAPRSAWPVSATTVTGTGATNSISDTTTDPNRFYSVRVH